MFRHVCTVLPYPVQVGRIPDSDELWKFEMLSDTDTGTYLHIPAHTYTIHAHTCTYLYIPAYTLAGPGVTPGPAGAAWAVAPAITDSDSQSVRSPRNSCCCKVGWT